MNVAYYTGEDFRFTQIVADDISNINIQKISDIKILPIINPELLVIWWCVDRKPTYPFNINTRTEIKLFEVFEINLDFQEQYQYFSTVWHDCDIKFAKDVAKHTVTRLGIKLLKNKQTDVNISSTAHNEQLNEAIKLLREAVVSIPFRPPIKHKINAFLKE